MGSCPDTDIDPRNDLRSNEHYLSASENKA